MGFTVCPIVHGADDEAVMNGLQSLPSMLETARSRHPGRDWHLGPSRLSARASPLGRQPCSDGQKRMALASRDPRSRGLFGAAWAFIPAWLQAKRGSHIVITTIMFNFIAASLMAYLLVDVFKPPGSMATESKVFAVASWLPKMSELAAGFGIAMPNSPLNISFFWALICAALVWVFIWHTRWGYEIRSVGASQSASAYAGISYPKVVILAMVISGMLAGFFALNVLQGELHQIKLNFVEGFGFTGIAVALMGRNHPVGVIIASLLFGFLYQGGAELSFEFGVDRNIVVVLQGLVILFCGALEHMLRPRIEQAYLAFANRSTAQVKGV